MTKLLREPLLHFLLLGAAIFAVYSRMASRGNGEPGRIIITQGQIENLAAGFARAWRRPPSEEELAGLIRDRVREEVYCREAIALGLDKDDTIIRRRLRQKMEFVSDDIAAQKEPGDDELAAYLNAHPDKFRTEERFTFQQVCLTPQKRGASLARDAAQLLQKLNQAGDRADFSALGDSVLLEPSFDGVSMTDVAKQFGGKFAAKLAEVPAGGWQGPIESGFGSHLVRVTQRAEGRLPELAEVRDAVRREWGNTRRLEANENFYQELLKRYTVTIEQPDAKKKTAGAGPK